MSRVAAVSNETGCVDHTRLRCYGLPLKRSVCLFLRQRCVPVHWADRLSAGIFACHQTVPTHERIGMALAISLTREPGPPGFDRVLARQQRDLSMFNHISVARS